MPDERKDEGKKVLMLGNGLDLAYGLPTKYSDFLNFVELYIKCMKKH